MPTKKAAISTEDAEQALAHMALRADDGGVVVSRDRGCSLMRDGERWSFYKSFSANLEGFDEMLEFCNWCGARKIEVTRNTSVSMQRSYGIMGWIATEEGAQEFRMRWV